MSKLRELVDKVNGLWAPEERPFTSSAPVIGPIIVSMRRALNWMSAKWYVRPILEQQIAFNSTVVQIINELGAIIESQDRELAGLRNRLAAVLSRLDQELERTAIVESSLSNQIREAEDLTIANDRASVSAARDLSRLRHQIAVMTGVDLAEIDSLRQALSSLERVVGARPVTGERDADSVL